MTTPIQHGLLIGAYQPIIKEYVDDKTRLTFTDEYWKFYRHFGLFREEMMVVAPFSLRVDPLVGNARLEYYVKNK